MKMLRSGYFCICLILVWFLISCRSTPKFTGSADLCGLVIDDKNQPVEEMIISCRNNGIEIACTQTNESGLFIVENLSSGTYEIYACKSGYEKLEKVLVKFSSRDNVYCFQVSSGDVLLDEVEQLFSKKKFDDGLLRLEKLGYEQNDSVNALVCFYKAYAYAVQGKKKESQKELKKISGMDKNQAFDLSAVKKIIGGNENESKSGV